MIEHIKANAEMTIEKLRPVSGIDFGYTPESVEWLDGYIERLRLSGQFDSEDAREALVGVLGSFFGECIIRCYGGAWVEQEGVWSVAFDDRNGVFPFAKVARQLENGLEDSIWSMFSLIPEIFAGCLPSQLSRDSSS
jgi:hypothetical protein